MRFCGVKCNRRSQSIICFLPKYYGTLNVLARYSDFLKRADQLTWNRPEAAYLKHKVITTDLIQALL